MAGSRADISERDATSLRTYARRAGRSRSVGSIVRPIILPQKRTPGSWWRDGPRARAFARRMSSYTGDIPSGKASDWSAVKLRTRRMHTQGRGELCLIFGQSPRSTPSSSPTLKRGRSQPHSWALRALLRTRGHYAWPRAGVCCQHHSSLFSLVTVRLQHLSRISHASLTPREARVFRQLRPIRQPLERTRVHLNEKSGTMHGRALCESSCF